eukprot:m.17902 g.17902  ORF g.17902 m.17902 type:complete len:312 (-) comp5572_c0_seq1:77-1012(-)
MWDNTIVVFTTDNGGPTTTGDGVGARNWPLRGGKHSIFEGGVRGTALIRAPKLKEKNSLYPHLMHGADWLPTLCDAVGIPTNGTKPLDGVSQWTGLLHPSSSKPSRTQLVIGNSTNYCGDDCGFGIRVGEWKYMRGGGGKPDTWYPPVNETLRTCQGSCNTTAGWCFPNDDITSLKVASPDECCAQCLVNSKCEVWTYRTKVDAAQVNCYIKRDQGEKPEHDSECVSGWPAGKPAPPVPPPPAAGTLYNISADPTEHNDQAASNPDTVKQLDAMVSTVLETFKGATNDPSCPFPKAGWPSTPQGKIMEPWC